MKKIFMITLAIVATIFVVALILYYLLIGSFKKVEPKIITLQDPIKMIGVSIRTTQKTIFKDAVSLGKEYKKIKEQEIILNKKTPWQFVAISKDFEGEESWEYLMGDVVTNLDSIPMGLKSFEIPPMTYAVFTIKPKSRFAWGISIGRMKKYIYTEWINNSGYELDNKVIGDFELHDEKSEQPNPEIDLYVAIKEKKK
jgi:predicted transcriptional regulator YdeE